jgi:tRNA (guanine-N7-)-methyltransferase
VENPTRTAAYRALIEERRQDLRVRLGRILPRGAEFTWEVGCGHGHFLTAFAQAHPQSLCVGIDIIGERIERANRKRDRARLPNLHFLHADAQLFLEEIPVSNSVAELFVLFPDPWPKLRHHKHRLFQPAFLHAAADHARPGCRLHFRTDHHAYYMSAVTVLDEHPRWQVVDVAWPFEYDTVFQQRAPAYHSLSAEWRP